MFRSFSIWTINEMTLDGNKLLKEVKRLKFYPDTKQNEVKRTIEGRSVDETNNEVYEEAEFTAEDARYYGIDYVVTLKPMQIRTYVITLQPQL